MTIKQSVYENLDNQQRMSALMEALQRNDVAEAARLMNGVPRKTYDLPDAEFTDSLALKILEDAKIEDKAGVYSRLQSLMGRKDATNGRESLQLTIVHKRSATWPPEDIRPGEEASDEFLKH